MRDVGVSDLSSLVKPLVKPSQTRPVNDQDEESEDEKFFEEVGCAN